MTILEVSRKLRAWDTGKPLPRFSTIHHAIVRADNVLIVAFVRMAGESRPWGIAWGKPGSAPTITSVPDGRDRDDVASLCVEFGEDLLEHFRVHNWTYDPLPNKAGVDQLRQVWVPNGQHVAMFHQLDYAYSQTKFGGSDVDVLNAVGRLTGWLFRDSSRRGHQHLIDASAALREAFTFPAQDTRQAHLGYLLGWLTTEGGRDERLAAASCAESLPVSPTMDPVVERDELERLVASRRERKRNDAPVDRIEAEIEAVLERELSHRWSLAEMAYDRLDTDDRRPNVGVNALVESSMNEFWYQVQGSELKLSDPGGAPPFIPHPETDFHGSSAASRYLTFASADERYINLLVHDDNELFSEALQTGHGLRGRVLAVEDASVDARKTRPVWIVDLELDRPRRIREGARLVPLGSSGHWAEIVSIEQDELGLRARLEWNGRKTIPISAGIGTKPIDIEWVGVPVDFIISDAADLTQRRSQAVWKAKDGPGAWLTHGKAPVLEPLDIANEAPEFILDDVRQIEGEAL